MEIFVDMKLVFFCRMISGLFIIIMLASCGNGTPEENLVSAIRAAETGNWKDAGKFADRAVAGAPDHVGALIMRAIACEANEKYDQAIDSARRAANLDPSSFVALYTLGRLYSSDPLRNAEAINTLNSALRIRPDSAETRILICNIFNRMSAVEGRIYLMQLSKNDAYKKDPALWSQLGVIYTRTNKQNLAYNAFVQAYKIDNKNPDVVFNIARFMSRFNTHKNFSKQLYAHFINIASGREKYTAELDEAKAAIGK